LHLLSFLGGIIKKIKAPGKILRAFLEMFQLMKQSGAILQLPLGRIK
jgi:hypothetical protein